MFHRVLTPERIEELYTEGVDEDALGALDGERIRLGGLVTEGMREQNIPKLKFYQMQKAFVEYQIEAMGLEPSHLEGFRERANRKYSEHKKVINSTVEGKRWTEEKGAETTQREMEAVFSGLWEPFLRDLG
jgi:hypothetical protein